LLEKKRDHYLSAAASFFLPGLGQVYCGRILRGIVFLVPSLLLVLLDSFLGFNINYGGINLWIFYATPVNQIVEFAVRIVATYDAYNLAKGTGVIQSDRSSMP
jgi:TM2 domain-containing membrane protein YozV